MSWVGDTQRSYWDAKSPFNVAAVQPALSSDIAWIPKAWNSRLKQSLEVHLMFTSRAASPCRSRAVCAPQSCVQATSSSGTRLAFILCKIWHTLLPAGVQQHFDPAAATQHAYLGGELQHAARSCAHIESTVWILIPDHVLAI